MQVHDSCTTIIHSSWDGNVTNGYDVALIELSDISKKTPVDLDITGKFQEGMEFTAVGWGRDESGSISPSLVLTDELRYITLEQCKNIPAYEEILMDNMLCAFGGRAKTCQGSAMPLNAIRFRFIQTVGNT